MKKEEKEVEFADMGTVDKVLHVMEVPFAYVRKVTLPPCEPE
jgi:hypothetical protein